MFAVAKSIELRIELVFSNFKKKFFVGYHDDGLLVGLGRLRDGDDFLLLVGWLFVLLIVRIVLLVGELITVVIVVVVMVMVGGLLVD